MITHKAGKKGDRKFGRNKTSCAWYKSTHRREKNKIRKVTHHLKKHPNDKEAVKCIERLREVVKGVYNQ